MRKLAVLMAVVVVFAFAVPVLANPFVDVPMNHWAYDAVAQLAAKGILQGYPDGTFQGTKPMTRYEFAVATARALAYVENHYASKEDLAVIQKLVVEFQDELKALGVKVDAIDKRLGVVEKNLNGFQFSGEFRFDALFKSGNGAATTDEENINVSRARIYVTKQVDDKVSVHFRFDGDSGTLSTSRAYTVVSQPWGFTMTAGKACFDWEGAAGLYADNDAIWTDIGLPMFSFTKKFGVGDITLLYGQYENDGTTTVGGTDYLYDRFLYGARLNFNISSNFRLAVSYLKWAAKTDAPSFNEPSVLFGDFTVTFTDGVKLYGIYGREDTYDENPNVWKAGLAIDQKVLKFTSLTIEYLKAEKNSFIGVDGAPYAYLVSTFPTENGLDTRLTVDHKVLFVMASQQWNDKISTTERYYSDDADNDLGGKGYTFTIKYQYTPSTYFELAYDNADYDDDTKDEDAIRARVFVSF